MINPSQRLSAFPDCDSGNVFFIRRVEECPLLYKRKDVDITEYRFDQTKKNKLRVAHFLASAIGSNSDQRVAHFLVNIYVVVLNCF